jgi:hypothetical protein
MEKSFDTIPPRSLCTAHKMNAQLVVVSVSMFTSETTEQIYIKLGIGRSAVHTESCLMNAMFVLSAMCATCLPHFIILELIKEKCKV